MTVDTVLLAWVLGQTDAIDASISTVDEKGFTICATCRSPYSGAEYRADTIHEFAADTPLMGKAGVMTELSSMKERSRVVCWPPGPIPIVCALFLLCCLICTTDEIKADVTSIYVKTLRNISLTLLQSPHNARILSGLIICTHAMEGIYTAVICRRLKFSALQTASWVSLVLFLGYAVTARVLFLEKVASSDITNTKKVCYDVNKWRKHI